MEMETPITSDAIIDFGDIVTELVALECKKCELYYPALLAELQFISEVYVDETHHINFFLQDQLMEKVFENYPDYLLIDTSIYIPKLDRFLALFICMDSNGQCSIVSIGLIKGGNEMGMVWTMNAFKNHNENSRNTIVFLADRQSIIDRVDDFFPNAFTCAAFFDHLERFQKDLRELNNVPVNQVDILDLFMNLFTVRFESQYRELLEKMKHINVDVYDMFMRKWNKLRGNVMAKIYIDSKVFLKRFHVFSKCATEKLNLELKNLDSLEQVIRNIHSTISSLRADWFKQIAEVSHSPTAPYLEIPLMKQYSNFLTPFASELVYEQLTKSEEITNMEKINDKICEIDGIRVTSKSCGCDFYYITNLPCCHLFFLRKCNKLSEDVELVGSKWQQKSYSDNAHMHLAFDITEVRLDEAFKNIPIDDYIIIYEVNGTDNEDSFMDITEN